MWPRSTGSRPARNRVVILVENISLDHDRRVQRQCRSLLDAGFDVTVICPSGEPGDLEPELASVRLMTYPRSWDASGAVGYVVEYGYSLLATWILLAWLGMTRGFDAVQVCTPPDLLWLVAAPFRLIGRPVVLDQHDLSPELFEARFGRRGAIRRALLAMESLAMRNSDGRLATNETGLSIVSARSGVEPNRFTIVRNAPPLADLQQSREPRSELKGGKRWLCLWPGIMAASEGPTLAIEAAASLVHELGRKDCGFAFLGDGKMRPDLERLVDKLDLREWVWFPGWVEKEGVLDYLATADIGLSPDPAGGPVEWATPTKAHEFMAFGVPVVGFQRLEQMGSVGEAGAFVADNSPAKLAVVIDQLLDDPERRRRMGKHGRKRMVELLAWDHQGRRYIDLYRQLLNGRRVLER